jgi:hypothetical protein
MVVSDVESARWLEPEVGVYASKLPEDPLWAS